MKKFLFSVLAMALCLVWAVTEAQERHPWQVGLFGGGSATLGNYHHDTARANLGYVGGLFADHYFGGGTFGLGLDARFIEHPVWGTDSLFFRNGYLATTYQSPKRFRHLGIAIGPSYRFTSNRFDLELFAKGGVLFQQFPEYTRELVYNEYPPRKNDAIQHSVVIRNTANQSPDALAWMGVGGLRFSYRIARNVSVFLQGDYLTIFGERFGSKPSEFFIEERLPIASLDAGSFVDDPDAFFDREMVTRKAHTQMVNISAGLKYAFGGRNPKPLKRPGPEPVVPATPMMAAKSDITVVVKDKQTGLALSGVKVTVKGNGVEHISLTNSNGEAERLTGIQKGTYRITGEKNGVSATGVTVTPEDFQQPGSVIYKELLHDDPRFTLIGETVECEDGSRLTGISTVLTDEGNDTNISQVSDGEGKFVYQLNQQSNYNVVANQAGRYSQTERVSTMGLNRSKTLYVTLKLGVCALEEGASWVVKNILYDFDRSDIRRDAALVLDNVANILRQNPSLRIELSSHTDSRGNDAYNLRLSQRRAESAVQYLIGKGIDRDRMVARGYGETQLVNGCGNGVDCAEEDHEQNRRTEIRVLDY